MLNVFFFKHKSFTQLIFLFLWQFYIAFKVYISLTYFSLYYRFGLKTDAQNGAKQSARRRLLGVQKNRSVRVHNKPVPASQRLPVKTLNVYVLTSERNATKRQTMKRVPHQKFHTHQKTIETTVSVKVTFLAHLVQ